MQVAGIQPLIQQTLLTALARAEQADAPVGVLAIANESTSSSAGTSAAAMAGPPATSVQMLVALAATETDRDRRRRIARDTERGLDALEALHRASLDDDLPVERLEALRAWADAKSPSDERKLGALEREVELRVRVELAKHDVRI